MKKINLVFLSLLVLAVFCSSCTTGFDDGRSYIQYDNNGNIDGDNDTGNDNDTGSDTGNPIAESGAFKALIDGNTFIANDVEAIVIDDYISISGIKANGELIGIGLLASKVGTYTFKNDNKNKLGILSYGKSNEWVYLGVSDDDAKENGYADYYSDTTIITITEIDTNKKTISGTFQFTGVRVDEKKTKEITNGSFTKISYKEDSPVLQPDNKFSAKLDGADFITTNVSVIPTKNKISITGKRGTIENISIFFPSDVKEGTYEVDFDYVIRYGKNMYPDGIFDGKKGSTITILKHDKAKKTISGTFSGTMVTYTTSEKYEITDGSFNVKY